MASAGNGVSVTTSGVSGNTQIFAATTDGGPCQAFAVANRSASSGNVLVNIPYLHNPGDWFGIAPGNSYVFVVGLNVNGISRVDIKSDSTATADFGVVKKS